jgi:hypothetical protein
LRDGIFHHIALSVNRTSTTGGNLYVDGESVLLFDPTPRRGSLASENPLLFGIPASGISNAFFSGLIDEAAIYSRALSASEILAIKRAGSAGKCKVKPSIIVQPRDQRATLGSNVTFSVLAAGTPLLGYRWLNNGQADNAGIGSSYTFIAKTNMTLSVRVTNLFGSILSSNATLTINHVPVAFAQSVALNEDTPMLITLGGSDPDGDTLSFPVFVPPSHGTLTGAGSNVYYIPSPNYFGVDSFSYQVNDGLVSSRPATVSITVFPVNDPPVAQPQTLVLDEDTTLPITLTAFDVDGDPLTFNVGPPSHGTLTGTPPILTYRPETNYFGPDTFNFTVNDGQTNSELAKITLTIRPINDPPVAKISVSPLVQLPGITNRVVVAAICANGTVILDASESTDVEHDPLTYEWFEGTNIFAQGIKVTNQFSPGTHELILQVSDGAAITKDTASLEVAPASEAVGAIILFTTDAGLTAHDREMLIHSLALAASQIDRCNPRATLALLSDFQRQLAKVVDLDEQIREQLRAAVQAIIDPNANGAPTTQTQIR